MIQTQLGQVARKILFQKEIHKLREETEILKELITQKNEGLHYARLLQEALFHDPRTLNYIFPQAFIYHSSKDIISGDFYWFEKVGAKVYVACVDCTGHGVPGAILSVLGINKLHEIITGGASVPAEILNELNSVIYNALGKKYGPKKMRDGMDMALFSVNLETNVLDFSGANNPLLIIREGNLIELNADKQSIGHSLDQPFFSNKNFQLLPDDMIYIFSDGYADQFGGEKGKKFTRGKFKSLLLSIANENSEMQKNILHETLVQWKSGHEQTDDICVIGVRVM